MNSGANDDARGKYVQFPNGQKEFADFLTLNLLQLRAQMPSSLDYVNFDCFLRFDCLRIDWEFLRVF